MARSAPLGLSPRATTLVRRTTVFTVTLLALAAAVLSFSGLMDLALQSGFPPQLAWIFPLMIDGMVLTGSLGVIAATLSGVSTWYMWLLTLMGVAASVAGNVAAAADDLTSQLVHAAPPLVFALSIEGLLRVYRTQAEALVSARDNPPPPATDPIILGTAPVSEVKVHSYSSVTDAQPEIGQASSVQTIDQVNIVPAVHSSEGTARERLAALLEEEPDITGGEAARRLDIDPSHARKLLRTLRNQSNASLKTENEGLSEEPEEEDKSPVDSELIPAEEPAESSARDSFL